MVKEQTKIGQETLTVTPISLDVGAERLPTQTITLEEYRRFGGTPVREAMPRDASMDQRRVPAGRSSSTDRSGREGGSHIQTHTVEV